MKKIVFLIALTLMGSLCMAQRSGGSRSNGSVTRSSVSVSRPSTTRSSVSMPRSSASSTRAYTPSRVNTTPRSTNRNSSVYSRSETRSTPSVTNRTPQARNTPRMEERRVNESPRPEVRHPMTETHHGNHPHHPNGYGRPHHHPAPHGMHPMPPMHHPVHHRHVHMHHHVCYDWAPYRLYWYGYWNYVRMYPYNDVVVYVRNSYPSTHVVAVTTDEDYVYTIYRDELLNETYFTITDKTDNVVVKTVINKKYCRIMLDENGIWLLRKNNRKPIYFIFQDGNLYRYEED